MLDRDKRKVEAGKFPHLTTPEAARVDHPVVAKIAFTKNTKNCVTQLMLYTGDKLSSPIFCCLSVCQASVSPDQISTFSDIYRHKSPILTL